MSAAEVNAAVRNNADWVAAVCRAHGIGYTFGPRAWRSAGPTPRFYPEAITLRPAATPDDLLPAGSIKDSFATLDLAPHGFTELFAAEWIFRPAAPAPRIDSGRAGPGSESRRAAPRIESRRAAPRIESRRAGPRLDSRRVTSDAELQAWDNDALQPALLDDNAVRLMAVHDGDRLRGGFALNRTGGVVGLSNLFAVDDADLPLIWSAATSAAGDRPMVGYESGDDLAQALAAGFRSIGPLRIWAQNGVGNVLGDGHA